MKRTLQLLHQMLKSLDTAVWSVPTARLTLRTRYNTTTCCYSHHPQQAMTHSAHKTDLKHYIICSADRREVENKTEAAERKQSRN